jgi:hypothetical protein
MQTEQDAAQLQLKAKMQHEFDEDRKAAEAEFQRRKATIERFNEERHIAKDKHIEWLEDRVKYLQSAKGATSTQVALDTLEMASSAGLWSN